MKSFVKGLAVALVVIALAAAFLSGIVTVAPQEAEAQFLSMATGTAVASSASATITVPVGFIPRVVSLITNTTTVSSARAYWQSQMPNAAMFLESNSTNSYVTSGGISPYSGSTTTAPGFRIGNNAVLNNGQDIIYWQAIQ